VSGKKTYSKGNVLLLNGIKEQKTAKPVQLFINQKTGKMEIGKFRSTYHLELIPASHAGIHLGDLVWVPLFGSPRFSKSGMPNTIYNAFLDASLISEDEWKIFSKECRSERLADAHIAERSVDVNVELVPELLHPEIDKLNAEFKLNLINKFTFGDIRVREMDDLLRVKIDRYLELLKSKNWSEYDGRIRRVQMITELYYGTIRLVIEKTLSNDFETALQDNQITVKSKTEGSSSVEYAFSNKNVPFAMRIEQVRNFNG